MFSQWSWGIGSWGFDYIASSDTLARFCCKTIYLFNKMNILSFLYYISIILMTCCFVIFCANKRGHSAVEELHFPISTITMLGTRFLLHRGWRHFNHISISHYSISHNSISLCSNKVDVFQCTWNTPEYHLTSL